jgi:hypothetical protein
MSPTPQVAIGLYGRTAVALTGVGDDLGVVARAEVRTRESQPFHDAQNLAIEEAERLIASAAEAAVQRAADDLRQLTADLAKCDLQVVRAAVVAREYRLPKTLAATLRSHPACHAAEGQMTNDALTEACNILGLDVVVMTDVTVAAKADGVGRLVGAPWRKEHKLAATAALRALAWV